MKRRNIIEEDAVTHVIEFTIALTVFVIILQAFTSSMNFRIGIDLKIMIQMAMMQPKFQVLQFLGH